MKTTKTFKAVAMASVIAFGASAVYAKPVNGNNGKKTKSETVKTVTTTTTTTKTEVKKEPQKTQHAVNGNRHQPAKGNGHVAQSHYGSGHKRPAPVKHQPPKPVHNNGRPEHVVVETHTSPALATGLAVGGIIAIAALAAAAAAD